MKISTIREWGMVIIICAISFSFGWDGLIVIQSPQTCPDAPLMKWFDRQLNGEKE